MKLGSTITAVLLIGAVIVSSASYLPMNMNESSIRSLVEDPIHSNSDTIRIDSVDDFAAGGWSGNGTESDPFVLENKALGSTENYGYVTILNTDCYFVIRGCYLLLMDVAFGSLSHGRIEDCTLVNSSLAISDSSKCTVIGNEFSYSAYDMETIFMVRTSDCEIRQNHFSYGFYGIMIFASNNTIISDNAFAEFTYGAISGDLSKTTLTNNVFDNTGVKIEVWDSQIASSPPVLDNNSVNGKDIGFFYNIEDVQIEAELYGQIILGNCTETTVVGGTFVACTTGVQFAGCANCTIDGTIVSDCWQGISIESSTGTRIVDCHVSNSLEDGIFLSSSPFYRIENCTLQDNLNGILPHIYSNNGTVVNCTIKRNKSVYLSAYVGVGIFLSNNATAIGNTLTGNNVGIFIYGGHCLVVQNLITYNEYGIYLAEEYDGYGENCYANRIYGNDIGWNRQVNAYDASWRYNEWDDGISEGNGWSDYYGIGYYQISYNSIDHFPRFLPEGGIPLFFIHLSAGIISSIMLTALLIVTLKRHGVTGLRRMQNTSLS
jgi:parallel beta-helix repeat protein